jgi:hypothetical protein
LYIAPACIALGRACAFVTRRWLGVLARLLLRGANLGLGAIGGFLGGRGDLCLALGFRARLRGNDFRTQPLLGLGAGLLLGRASCRLGVRTCARFGLGAKLRLDRGRGSRIRFLRKVYAGEDGRFEVMPAQRFARDPHLAPMVANAGSAAMLVRVDRNDAYRTAAVEPIALIAESEKEALRPLLRRRAAATSLLVGMLLLGSLATVAHG